MRLASYDARGHGIVWAVIDSGSTLKSRTVFAWSWPPEDRGVCRRGPDHSIAPGSATCVKSVGRAATRADR